MGSVLRDLRYAIRSLRKDRKFLAIGVFALALGIGASTVVFSVFYNLLFNALAARDANRLVVPVVRDEEKPGYHYELWVSWTDVKYLREHNQVFENVVGSHSGIAVVQYGTKTYQFESGHVSADAFDFYGVAPILGRGIFAGDGKPGAPPVFVMSYRTWQGQFGTDPDIIGKTFVVEGQSTTLVGVMPERFHGFGASQEIWIPTNEETEAEKSAGVHTLARLKRGVTLASASAEMGVLAKRLAAMHPNSDDYPKKFSARVMLANEYLMGPSGAGVVFNSKIDLKTILYDLLAAVLVLLLIACSNVANLLLTRATAREKELALRSALGASRWQIVRQLMVESLLLASIACIAGCAMARMAMRAVDTTIHQKAWQRMSGEAVIGLNGSVLLFALAITLLTTLICGLVPALRATKRDLQPQLVGSGKATGGLRHSRVRAALVVGQVALSIVLLIGAGLMVRSLYRLTHIDMGFNPKNILVAGFCPSRKGTQLPDRASLVTPEGRARFQRAVEKIRELPGVANVAENNTIPGYGPSRGPRVGVPGEKRDLEAGMNECDENCLDTLEMRLIAGRWLSHAEVQSRQFSAVLNERLAHALFGEANPVGRQFEVRGFKTHFRFSSADLPENPVFQIVGLVGDTKSAGPQAPMFPMAFIPPMISGDFIVQIRTKKAEPASIMHAVQEAVWSADPGEVFWLFDPLAEFLEEHTYALPEFGVSLSGPLAGIALLLVVIGVFSVMSYTVSLQTQEIGIRMALGAQQAAILGMVLLRGAALVAAGTFIGLIASFGLTRFLASQIWGVSATDPWTFGAVTLLLVLVGASACLLPARRASSVDPLVALHYE